MKIPGKTMWPRFNDGSVGARLGGYLGGMIVGCSPFKDGIGHLIDVFDAADSPPWSGDHHKPKPKSVSVAGERTATADDPVTVNGFGNGYTAKPGDILGKDGKDGLKTMILRQGEPAVGVDVEFSVPVDSGLYFTDADGQHVTSVKATTDANGEAVAPVLYAGDKEGDFAVTVTADALGAIAGEKPTGTYTVHVKK